MKYNTDDMINEINQILHKYGFTDVANTWYGGIELGQMYLTLSCFTKPKKKKPIKGSKKKVLSMRNNHKRRSPHP